MPYDVIERLLKAHGHAAVLQDATVTHGEVTPPDRASPRRIMNLKADGVDLKDTTSDAVFQVQVMAAVERGIRLKPRIRKLEPGVSPAEGLESTVFWTWGEVV